MSETYAEKLSKEFGDVVLNASMSEPRREAATGTVIRRIPNS